MRVSARVISAFVAGLVVASGASAVLSLWRKAQAPPTAATGLVTFPASRPGWYWIIAPIPLVGGKPSTGVAVCRKDRVGSTTLDVAVQSAVGTEPERRVQAVLLGANGRIRTVLYPRRYEGGPVVLYRFDLGVPDDGVELVGVEGAMPEGLKQLSQEARRSEGSRPITLPFPEVGKPFPFDLDLGAGGSVRSADYKGRVVVIDCWASWCKPCMTEMPALVDLYARLHPRGVDLVGVNFDMSAEEGQRAVTDGQMPWPQVFVGALPETVDHWYDATTLAGLPRVFVVDRSGVLRWDSTSTDVDRLEEAISSLL